MTVAADLPGAPGSAEAGPTVLVVDDDPTTVAMLVALLRREGLRTRSAGSGEEGLAVARETLPDLVLLDVNLPGESGISTCRRLKEDARTSDVPVLFVSAQDDTSSKIEGLEAGAVDYVTKPFHRAEVLARVRTQLRLRAAFRALLALRTERLATLAVAQQALLVTPDDVPGARFAVHFTPFHEAGGDMYDVVPVGEDVFDYVVADVSGHGVGSALAAAAFKALVRQNASLVVPPAEALAATNQALRAVLRDGQHVTALAARLNRRARTLTVVAAGHPAPILLRGGAAPSAEPLVGDVLGVFPTVTFGVRELRVTPGDRVFLFTDGLLEAGPTGPWPRRVGLAALLAEVARTAGAPLAEVVATLPRAVLGSGPPSDDVLLLGLEV